MIKVGDLIDDWTTDPNKLIDYSPNQNELGDLHAQLILAPLEIDPQGTWKIKEDAIPKDMLFPKELRWLNFDQMVYFHSWDLLHVAIIATLSNKLPIPEQFTTSEDNVRSVNTAKWIPRVAQLLINRLWAKFKATPLNAENPTYVPQTFKLVKTEREESSTRSPTRSPTRVPQTIKLVKTENKEEVKVNNDEKAAQNKSYENRSKNDNYTVYQKNSNNKNDKNNYHNNYNKEYQNQNNKTSKRETKEALTKVGAELQEIQICSLT